MNAPALSEYTFAELRVGMAHSFETIARREDVDALARISGDMSPLHTDADFARSRGHQDRVVHGVLLASYASRLVGVHLPGRNCLLLALQGRFPRPTLVDDQLQVVGTVTELSPGTNTAMLSIVVQNITRGYVTAKFTATVLVTA